MSTFSFSYVLKFGYRAPLRSFGSKHFMISPGDFLSDPGVID